MADFEVWASNTYNIDGTLYQQVKHVSAMLEVNYDSFLLGGLLFLLHEYNQQNKLTLLILQALGKSNSELLPNFDQANYSGFTLESQYNHGAKVIEQLRSIEKIVYSEITHVDDLTTEKYSDFTIDNPDTKFYPTCVAFMLSATNQQLFKKNNLDTIDGKQIAADLIVVPSCDDLTSSMTITCYYIKDKFSPVVVDGIISNYIHVIDQLSLLRLNSKTKIKDLNYVTQKEQQQIISWSNRNMYQTEATEQLLDVCQLFTAQAKAHPNNIALVYQERKITYGELENITNKFAYYLQTTYEIAVGDILALYLDRSEYIVIAILAILKSGAAYLPIDNKEPRNRTVAILSDAHPKVILTDSNNYDYIATFVANITIDIVDSIEMLQRLTYQYRMVQYKHPDCLENLAYVLYTSGTTGQPKGIMMGHRSCAVRIMAMIKNNNMTDADKVLFKTNYVFDVSFSDIFNVLCCGAALYITCSTFDSEEIDQLIKNEQITVCHFVPTQFSVLASILNINEWSSLRLINFSGEGLHRTQLKCLIDSKVSVVNYYGPTETGEVTYEYVLDHGQFIDDKCNNAINTRDIVTIGKPINQTYLYILNGKLQFVPVGAIGELYIGGSSVANGYINNIELTDEYFVVDPLTYGTNNNKAILYRTGDLGRYLPNGNIQYLGRNDLQIKIRGLRVELSNIEYCLNRYPQIEQSVVVLNRYLDIKSQRPAGPDYFVTHCFTPGYDRKKLLFLESNKQYLIAYYVAQQALNDELLTAYLLQYLPDYMLPSQFVHVFELPMTSNGKLDYSKLPLPTIQINDNEDSNLPVDERMTAVYDIIAQALDLQEGIIGSRDDFFQLGGDSIVAVLIASKLRSRFALKISAQDIFKYRNIGKLCQYILHCIAECSAPSVANNVKHTRLADIDNVIADDYLALIQQETHVEQIYLATSLQSSIIYTMLHSKDSKAYKEQLIYRYLEAINLDHLQSAWQYCQANFQSLRSRFAWQREIVQIIDKHQDLHWYYFDASALDLNQQQEKLKQLIDQDNQIPYSLEHGQLFRVYLLKFNDNDYYCIFSYSHIILDGWSIQKLFDCVHDAYNMVANGEKLITVADYSYILARKYLQCMPIDKNFWQQHLEQILDYPDLSGLVRNSKRTINLAEYKQDIEPKVRMLTVSRKNYLRCKQFVHIHGVTTNVILQFVWHKLLSMYGNSNTTLVATVVAGRNLPCEGIDDAIGLFMNTVPIVMVHNGDNTIIEALSYLQRAINDVGVHSNVSLAELKTKYQLNINNLFVFNNYHMLSGITAIKCELDFANTIEHFEYPLAVAVYEQIDAIIIKFCYAEELFAQATIDRLIKVFNCIFEQVLTNPQEEIRQLNFIPGEEYKQIVDVWNRTTVRLPMLSTLHEMFDYRASIMPHNIAVVNASDGQMYRYSQLRIHSDYLANYLYSNTLKKIWHTAEARQNATLIGLFSEKNYVQAVGILSILKSGCGYLPLNIDWPLEKMDKVLQYGLVQVLLVSKQQAQRVDILGFLQNKYKVIVIEDVINNVSDSVEAIDNKQLPSVQLTDIAYVLFTSGSTGEPKGVSISHAGVLNTVSAINQKFEVNANDRVLALSELNFDLSVYDFFAMLFVGGSIVYPDHARIRDQQQLAYTVHKYRVTIWNSTPQLANLFIDEINDKYNALPLRLFLLSGDWIKFNLVKQIRRYFLHSRIINVYGPTETTIWSTWYNATSAEYNELPSVPCGVAMPNQRVYILDANEHLVPVNGIGELAVAGASLAIGYWHNIESTNKSFVVHKSFGRIYKTGDLARWHSEGYVEYLGRKDNQVKINGCRVELQEIELMLNSYPEIEQSIVIIKQNDQAIRDADNKQIVGFYIAHKKLSEELLQEYLVQKLPSYMLPSRLIQLEQMPLNSNGKLDYRVLQRMSVAVVSLHEKPRNELDKILINIITEILHYPPGTIGINDDFFQLGGDSIKTILLIGRLRKLQFHVEIKTVFTFKTIKSLSNYIAKQQNVTQSSEYENRSLIANHANDKNVHLVADGDNDRYLVNNFQHYLMDYHLRCGNNGAYHVQIGIKYNCPIDSNAMYQAWQLAINKYPALRLRFIYDQQYLQCIDKHNELNWQFLDFSSFAIKTQQKKIKALFDLDMQTNYDLIQGNLLRIYLLKLANDNYTLLLSYHQAILDGWGMAVLVDFVHQAYANLVTDIANIELLAADVSYITAQQYLQHSTTKEPIWQKELALVETYQLDRVINLSQRIKIENNYSAVATGVRRLSITGKEYEQIKYLAHTMRVTISTILQYIWHKLLHKYCGTIITVAGVTVSGRALAVEDIENAVGLFMNILPLIFDHSQCTTIEADINWLQAKVTELNNEYANWHGLRCSNHKLFDTLFIVDNYPPPRAQQEILQWSYQQEIIVLDYPLNVIVKEYGDSLTIDIRYDVKLFTDDDIQLIDDDIQQMLESISA